MHIVYCKNPILPSAFIFVTMKTKSKPIPFGFVLDLLYEVHPVIKPMFGSVGVYAGEKIVMILRKKEKDAHANGVWVATAPEHHESLKKLLPSMRDFNIFGINISNWQLLPAHCDMFEEEVTILCELIRRKDERIGRIPKGRKKKK